MVAAVRNADMQRRADYLRCAPLVVADFDIAPRDAAHNLPPCEKFAAAMQRTEHSGDGGIGGMRRRVRQLGGRMELYTVPRFRIELSVPKEAVEK